MLIEDEITAVSRAIAIGSEFTKSLQDGTFAEVQRLLSEVGYRIEFRKVKKAKSTPRMKNKGKVIG